MTDYSPLPWFTQVTTALCQGQRPEDAREWAERLESGVRQAGGPAPFTAIHRWHARTLHPLLEQALQHRGRPSGAQRDVLQLHHHAATGGYIGRAEWVERLEPAIYQLFLLAYPSEASYKVTYVNAQKFAIEAGRDESEIPAYARDFAQKRTEASARAFARSNSSALTHMLADAYAVGDAAKYAQTMPYAQVRAFLAACTTSSDRRDNSRALSMPDCSRLLAEGLIDSLAGATSTEVA